MMAAMALIGFTFVPGLERGSPEYEALKQERSQVLWRAVERVIPDIRQRTEVEMVSPPSADHTSAECSL
jgi:hypothetical protein